MGQKINSAEIEALIRTKIKEKGLSDDITEVKFSEIKNAIKSHLKNTNTQPIEEQAPIAPEETINNNITPAQPTANAPETIAQTITVSKEATELAKKEGELTQKEKEISDKQADLANREAEFQRKQDELAYKPQIPAILNNIGNEQLFVFSENEISLGAEALSNTYFRLMSNPDEKRTMLELWTTDGKKSADLYIVKFEKLGEITFNPFEGISKFESKPISDGQNPSEVPVDGLTPEEAQASQEPSETVVDAIEPVADVSLPLSNDMGLKPIELDGIIKKRVEDMMNQYFAEKFPKM